MAGAEGVVDVTIGQRGHLLGEREVAFLFALVEADVFEDHDPTRLQAAGSRGEWTDRVVDLHHRPADQLLEPGGHLSIRNGRSVAGSPVGRPR